MSTDDKNRKQDRRAAPIRGKPDPGIKVPSAVDCAAACPVRKQLERRMVSESGESFLGENDYREALLDLSDYLGRLKHRAEVRGGPDVSAMGIADEAIAMIEALLDGKSQRSAERPIPRTCPCGNPANYCKDCADGDVRAAQSATKEHECCSGEAFCGDPKCPARPQI